MGRLETLGSPLFTIREDTLKITRAGGQAIPTPLAPRPHSSAPEGRARAPDTATRGARDPSAPGSAHSPRCSQAGGHRWGEEGCSGGLGESMLACQLFPEAKKKQIANLTIGAMGL